MNSNRKGFSLIEIMVGLAIGMIAMIVIMQVFDTSEKQKRTTSGGADAQSNGAIALYMIERDIRMAGWGLNTSSYANCNNFFSYCDGNAQCGGVEGALPDFNFASIKVVDGGTGSDSITAQFFANPTFGSFRYPTSTTITKNMPASSSILDVENVSGCEPPGADTDEPTLALLSQGGNCTLINVTHVNESSLKMQHNPGASGIYNPPGNPDGWPAYTKGATVSCFKAASNGPIFKKTYSVDDATRQLLRADNTRDPAVTNELVASDIVDFQVKYGVAPVGSQTVDDWPDASGPIWANPTSADQMRIKAVRIALVTRSTQYEKPANPGDTCIATTAQTVTNWHENSEFAFDPANYSDDWQCYRYKIFETVIPLRNVMWGNL